jgi:hypothetical protein
LNRKTQTDIARVPGVGGVTQQRFEYDGLDRRTVAFDDHGNIETGFSYDSHSRVVRESTELPGIGTFVTETAWRAENLRSGCTYPTGTVITREFDRLDRIAHVKDAAGTVSNYAYLGRRLLEETYPNGMRNTFQSGYDGIRRPIQLETRDASATPLLSFAYTWNRSFNRLSEQKNHDLPNSEIYAYDSDYRLTGFNRPNAGATAPLRSA